MEMLIYRLFGTFRCNTTAPLADIDYTKLGNSERLLQGSLGYNVNGIPLERAAETLALMHPDHSEEDDGPIGDLPLIDNAHVGDVQSGVTAVFNGFGMAYNQVYPNHDFNGMGVEIAWDADKRDSELDFSFTEGTTTTNETGETITGFRTTTKTLTTNAASVMNARLRGLTTGMSAQNVHISKKVGTTQATSNGAFATDIRFSDEGKSADLEISVPVHRHAVNVVSPYFTYAYPAGSMYMAHNVKLKDIATVAVLKPSPTGAAYKSFRSKVEKLSVGSLGIDTAALDSIDKLKAALQGCKVKITVHKATVEKGYANLSADHSVTLPNILNGGDDIAGTTIHFALYEFEGVDSRPNVLLPRWSWPFWYRSCKRLAFIRGC
uniref:Uncharacterized protein n=1 Tax=viral metagenome TaxID=1070528 RepID=A0A2V0RC29_9ZZZZ